MYLNRMIVLTIILAYLLISNFGGDVLAQNNNLTSQNLNVQLKEPLIQLISDVVYEQVPMAGYNNVAMKMDILKPEKDKKMPAIIYIPGGGFISANKDSYIQQRMKLAKADYVVASIEYRVAPTVTFPQPLEDVKAAIRYLKAHAEQFNIDPNKIGVMGDSAGGYLAAITGTTNGMKQFDQGDNLEQSSDIQAVVDLYGLSDLTKIGDDYSQQVQQAHKSAGATEALLVNGSPVFGGQDGGILANKEKAEAANPISYISKQTPPFLLMHGDQDRMVSPSQTQILHQALVEKGIESIRYLVKGADHGGVYWNQPEVMKNIIDFFNKYLK